MTTAPTPVRTGRTRHDAGHDPARDTRLAWWSLALYPFSFAGAFLVGEGLATWLFGWPDNPDPAVWEMLVATVPALLVFALPVLPAWHFGMRASRHGSGTGKGAAWLAVGLAVAFVAQNALAFFLG